jgi:formylglycine-generating enzyme required for sulfatase activity
VHILKPVIALTLFALATPSFAQTKNSVGIELKPIPAGSFTMGADTAELPKNIIDGVGVMSARQPHGDFDEVPAHKVTITKPFAIASTQITVEQYQQFDPTYKPNPVHPTYVTGISWDRAVAFCTWLSKKEGKPYRLPTEAEWEYVARAGSHTIYSTGGAPLALDQPNPWGIANMEVGRPEWTLDWYAPYDSIAQTNPIGPAHGLMKVLRGGGLDSKAAKNSKDEGPPSTSIFFARPANRASLAPTFHSENGNVTFRVVQAPMPTSVPEPDHFAFFQTAVKQTTTAPTSGSDPSKPSYHTRLLFPDIGKDRTMPNEGWRLGLPRGLGINWHNSAIQQLPNGDFLAAYYNNLKLEDDPDQTVITMRRRAGSEVWDMPEPFPYFADAANAAPVIWNDPVDKKIWMFWGTPRLIGNLPFYYTTSLDNGVHWTPVQLPNFPDPIGRYVSQPINSVVRGPDNSIYIPTDSTGKQPDGNSSVSAVWVTHDDGKTWHDTGGRTGGRHSTIVFRNDGALLAFGGKNSEIDHRMPLAISTDGGKTYTKQASAFDPLGSGERPSVIRLADGKLFFVEDQNPTGRPKKHDEGAQVALSSDEGKTWHIKPLPKDITTVGYTTATQSRDGLIHIVTSKNDPNNYEVELNEAWIMSNDSSANDAPATSAKVTKHTEKYPSGKTYATWSDGIASDGRTLLEGPEAFFYPNGKPMWTINFQLGEPTGEETYYREDGSKEWQKTHAADGAWTWQTFDHTGKQTAESHWRNKTLLDVKFPDVQ